MTPSNDPSALQDTVRQAYGKIARGERASCGPQSGCCGSAQVTERIGYDPGDLRCLPEGADMGLSCGNPTALASLRDSEIVLDLGSGGGLDCFIAGPKVGANGRVIGVDMTADMLSLARRGCADYRRRTGLDNVEFRLGEIEHLPAGNASVDVVISNCVLNLSGDKPQVWREISRVLRPGGRVAVSDLALLQPLPEEVTRMVEALIGCVGGAALLADIRTMMSDAGLTEIRLDPKPNYIKTLGELKDPIYRTVAAKLPASATLDEFITSVDISARKPSN